MASNCLTGLFGTYILGKEIGHGGNGTVRKVARLETDVAELQTGEFVIKILNRNKNDEERIERFRREIDFAKKNYRKITGIIPVFDHFSESESDCFWYLMPKAEEYEYHKGAPLSDFLTDMILLGQTIKTMHDRGFEHRDIKPSNILVYNNRIALTDYGLIYDDNNQDRGLTRFKEGIGAIATRPPELEPYRNKKGVDFKKSDVYMFAKTIWIYITGNKRGFPEEYRRNRDDIYLNGLISNKSTVEPLHRMMENATKTYWKDRITILDCLNYLYDQKSIEDDDSPSELVSSLIAQERLLKARTIDPDIHTYMNFEAISKCINILKEHHYLLCLKDSDGMEYEIGRISSIIEMNSEKEYMFKISEIATQVNSIAFYIDHLELTREYFVIKTSSLSNVQHFKGSECKNSKDFFNTDSLDKVINGVFEFICK